MKTFTEEVWYETNKDGTISIGFTQAYIRQKMPECFHVVQADVKQVTKDNPMLVLETNDCLESICAPVTGRVRHFNHKARDFPDQLKESDVILTVAPPDIAKKEVKANVVPVQFDYMDFVQMRQNEIDALWPGINDNNERGA